MPIIVSEPCFDREKKALEQLLQLYSSKDNIKVGRDFLPQCCASTMIMTTNIREWRYIIALRGDLNDNPLTIQLRNKIWTALNCHYPFFFPIGETNNKENPMAIYDAWGSHELAKLGD
jgi:hypothetical protein